MTEEMKQCRPLIIVSSRTGNTMTVAHAIHDAYAAAGAALVRVDALPESLEAFNPVLLGFWCDRGMAPEDMKAAAAKLVGKRLGCFATIGGDPGADRAKDWMARTSRALAEAGSSNTLEATFLSQGRIDPKLAEAMEKMMRAKAGPAQTPEEAAKAEAEREKREARRRAAETHPDRLDCLAAVEAFRTLLADAGEKHAACGRQGEGLADD